MLWGQGQGKEPRGGLLGSRRPHGLQRHSGAANFAQGEGYHRLVLASTSARSRQWEH